MKIFKEKMDGKIPTLPYIPKEAHLAGTSNYRIWKERMLAVLEAYDLDEFVLSMIDEPPEEDHNKHYIWKRVNGKVRSFIIHNVKDDIVSQVLNIKNAKMMWDRLAAKFDRITPMKRVSWEIQLRLLDPAKSNGMKEHISQMEMLRDRINSTGGSLSEEEMVVILLSQLYRQAILSYIPL